VFTAPFMSVSSWLSALICVIGLQVVVDGVVHSAGTFGEYPKVSTASGLKPVALMRTTAFTPAGTYVVPESVDAVPKVIATFGVTVNVAVATFPIASTTVMVCAPATPAFVVLSPAGILNRNTAEPCSVVSADVIESAGLVEPTTFPTETPVIVVLGPKPVTVAVTTVPTGPVAGDRVTVGVVSESAAAPTLFQESVKLNAAP